MDVFELRDRSSTTRRQAAVRPVPPRLAEQWQKEMASKFHVDATLVLPSTAGRGRHCLNARGSCAVLPGTRGSSG